MAKPSIVIIGAGMSGICLAIRLKQAGVDSFTLLEMADDLGGTWRDNTYPGAGCDIPSFLYCYSFAPKHDWKRRYARQPEILDYFRTCAERFGILPHIEFGTAVERAGFDEGASSWQIHTSDGGSRSADILVSAVGQLSRPRIPEITGLDSFTGAAFHSARWDHKFDFAGRDITVIGSAASAVQFIPRIAKTARKVFVFQRSPNWISLFRDTAYSPSFRWIFRNFPGAARVHRWWMFARHEWRILLNGKSTFLNACMTGWLRRSMRRRIPDDLESVLIPEYPAGCKRILLSNDYLGAIERGNVELVTDPITEIAGDSIITEAGSHRADGLIFATGFETGNFLAPISIRGRNGADLHTTWRSRPRAFLGMLVPEFPNFFMLYGPNTNLAHNSIIFMVECQVNYLLRCLRKMETGNLETIEIEREPAEQFDRRRQDLLDTTVWTGGCSNWYRNADGAIVNNWGSSTLSYWLKTRRPDLRQFRLPGEKNPRSSA